MIGISSDLSDVTFYQPVPFNGEWPRFKRMDCEERWQVIKSNIEDLSGKSILDIGCANGFFMFRFLQDGGLLAHGIEKESTSRIFVEEMAVKEKLNAKCFGDEEMLSNYYDIGLYLDLHYHEGINYLPLLKNKVGTLFVSTSGEGVHNNKKLEEELNKIYKSITRIHNGVCSRIIFKCENLIV